MKLVFATKKNVNGNRNYIVMDTENKTLDYNALIAKSEIIEVTRSKLNEIREMAKADGYHDKIILR